MPVYTYRPIAKLHGSLLAAGVDPAVVDRVMEGGEAIVPVTSQEAKVDWLRGAMCRMEALLAPEKCQSVRERCACCLGGRRLAAAKAIAREFESLDERIAAFDKTGIGGRVRKLKDGRIVCSFESDGRPNRCRCLPGSRGPMPASYCQCCGGQIKHHMQIALGRKLSVDVQSSVLSSEGKEPCVFVVKLEE